MDRYRKLKLYLRKKNTHTKCIVFYFGFINIVYIYRCFFLNNENKIIRIIITIKKKNDEQTMKKTIKCDVACNENDLKHK